MLFRRKQIRNTRKAIRRLIEQNADPVKALENSINQHNNVMKDYILSTTESSPLPRHFVNKEYVITFDKMVHSEFTKKAQPDFFYATNKSLNIYRTILTKLAPPPSE